MESRNLQEQNPKQIKTILVSVICCTYILNQHLKISAKKIWIFCCYLHFGHAVGLYRVTSGANTNVFRNTASMLQQFLFERFFDSFLTENLTVVRTYM